MLKFLNLIMLISINGVCKWMFLGPSDAFLNNSMQKQSGKGTNSLRLQSGKGSSGISFL